MIEERERRLIEAPPVVGVREKLVIEAPEPAGLITDGKESETEGKDDKGKGESDPAADKKKGMEIAVVAKEGNLEADVMAPPKDTRSAGVDGWKFRARNSLMFSPDADVSPYHNPASYTRPTEAKGDPKSIKHLNTRLPEQDDSSDSRGLPVPPSPTRSRIDAAISGAPYRPKSPTINNFSLVPNLPSPTPSELGPAAVKQLMTWGTLNATPRIISQSDDPIPTPITPFHIPAPSSREVISHKLSNNASKSLRTKAGLLGLGPKTLGISRIPAGNGRKGGGSMPPPSWTPRRADIPGNLTPAARRLLDRTTMGTAAARRAEAMGRIAGWEGAGNRAKEKDLNRVRWTPTPSRS